MKRSQLAIAVGAVLVVAWVAVVPGIIGMNAEAEMNKNAGDALSTSSFPVTAKLESFQRGWFSSTAKVDYNFLSAPQPIHLVVEHHINQFAIPFYRWAKITHTITMLDDKGVATPLPFNIDASTDKLFFGGFSSKFSAADVDWKSKDGLHIAGKQLALKIGGKTGEELQYEINVPSLTATVTDGLLNINLAGLNLDGNYKDEKSAADTWKQYGHIKLDNIDATKNGVTLLKLRDLAIDTDLKDHGESFDLLYQAKADKSTFGDAFSADDIRVDFSYLNLNKDALLKLQTASKAFYLEASKTPVAATAGAVTDEANMNAQLAKQKAYMSAMMKQVGGFITSSPGFKVDRFSLKTPNGDVAGTLEAHLDGKDFPLEALGGDNVMALLKERFSGKGSLNAARDVFVNAVDKKNTIPEAQQRQMKESQLKMLVDKGFVKDDGKRLSLESTFGPQGVAINGKRVM
ncbi:hypothetical protein LT85_1379 [Collimonas arenae]|uniref:DUF945 domain-containing protein n=1 Tax=Collimonas arenae TaxID=279058 RepID=A0A0A1FCF4_9BURK|nr:DUF945 family protein [Collimonas arenae]AIY40537.1 hypothetical protein LT85_1379 [Collimonas arenae]